MAAITAGSGATIAVTSIEKFLPAAIWKLQALENDPVRNPGAVNNVSSSMSDDSQSMTASVNFSATVADDGNGSAVITAIEYLTVPSGGSAHWTAGTGGTITSPTIQGAVFEAIRLIDSLENQSAKNPQAKKTVSYTISSASLGSGTGNVSISINITNFPLTSTLGTDGTQQLIGKDYLL